jgi:hypothetical protein
VIEGGGRAARCALIEARREEMLSCCSCTNSAKIWVAGVGAGPMVSRMLEGSFGWPGIRGVALGSRSDSRSDGSSGEMVVA